MTHPTDIGPIGTGNNGNNARKTGTNWTPKDGKYV
jgi:hypothetical protein